MTHKLITVLAIALAVPGWGAAQNGSPVPQPADVAQDLRILERKWTGALVLRDAKMLAEILDDTYLDADEEGNQTDKEGILAAVKSGDLKMTSIQLSGMKIHSFVYTAVVTGRALQSGTFKGQPVASTVVFTDVFAMINGTWKVVASHRSGPHGKPAQ
jgi:ketosteroid isomerase-like protein